VPHVSSSQDPTEHYDLASKMPQKVAAMKARVLELTPTLFNPDRCHPYKVIKSPTGAEYCSGYLDHAKATEFFGGFPGCACRSPSSLLSTKRPTWLLAFTTIVLPVCWTGRTCHLICNRSDDSQSNLMNHGALVGVPYICIPAFAVNQLRGNFLAFPVVPPPARRFAG